VIAMSTPAETVVEQIEQASPARTRLFSLDLFRGITMAAMIVVNNQSSEQAYWPLRHAEWSGWTPTDLIFPFFLFIVGVSLVFSFQARLQRGESRRTLILHTVRRSIVLFLIGLLLNGMASLQPSTWRIPGVLQRIAIVYCIASVIALYSGTRARVVWIALLTVGYWAIMRFVPVPGHGVPSVDVPLLHPDFNLAAYLDRKLMLGHMWEKTRDPEGLLSTIPAVATALCGVLTGEWLQTKRTPVKKVVGLFVAGVLGVIAGDAWGHWFPINKNLWTSSYVLFTAGGALICLALCCWVSDVKLHRGWWTKPFLILGTNAITAYVLSQLIGGWFGWDHLFAFKHLAIRSPALSSLFHSVLILCLCFLPVWWMYRRKIFLKV
jgi:predicted acyltransferase